MVKDLVDAAHIFNFCWLLQQCSTPIAQLLVGGLLKRRAASHDSPGPERALHNTANQNLNGIWPFMPMLQTC